MTRVRKAGIGALLGFLVLAVPARDPVVPDAPARGVDFAWNRTAYWDSLEARFRAARAAGCAEGEAQTAVGIAGLRDRVGALRARQVGPDDPALDLLEAAFFDLAPAVAACGGLITAYAAVQADLRAAVKDQSRGWAMDAAPARTRIYRLLYGSRLAVEEVLGHHPDALPALLTATEEPAATPSVEVAGVRIHSGDLLVSRGGYPTSALIARGSDFPGNFSHVALVHVDGATGDASTVEAHIERGVAISSAREYLADKKLRILVLRPRADHPTIAADPMLPHRAATGALTRARTERIPYDFAMDYRDPSKLFCSEVASSAYGPQGITLWTGLSTISAPGLRRWLASFGVRHFETQEPSDLEYDPQLVVVAEWRDPVALAGDRIDNAVTDALLERADDGEPLPYPILQLPLVRLLKAWSWLRERTGGIGPVPQGMSPTAALRNRAFGERHRRLAATVAARADSVARAQGYPPPYWTLVELARAAVAPPP